MQQVGSVKHFFFFFFLGVYMLNLVNGLPFENRTFMLKLDHDYCVYAPNGRWFTESFFFFFFGNSTKIEENYFVQYCLENSFILIFSMHLKMKLFLIFKKEYKMSFMNVLLLLLLYCHFFFSTSFSLDLNFL